MTRKPKPSGLPNKGKKQGRRPNDALPLRAYFLIVCEGASPFSKAGRRDMRPSYLLRIDTPHS